MALTETEAEEIHTYQISKRCIGMPEVILPVGPLPTFDYDIWRQIFIAPLDYQRLVILCTVSQRPHRAVSAMIRRKPEVPSSSVTKFQEVVTNVVTHHVATAFTQHVTPLVATLQEVLAKVTTFAATTAQLAEHATAPTINPEESGIPARTFAAILKTELKAH